ncbi:MAG TPA: nucleotidyltransferase family protein [Aggregatilineales bacterium]|nr:nucleotidyltransferase family protein [Aggregatilineales bacterium]
MDIREQLDEQRNQILQIADQYGVKNIRIFGSVARGEASLTSDIDLLVDLNTQWTLLEHVGFMQDLAELLGRKVDVVVEAGLGGTLRKKVLQEAVPL